MPSSDQSQLIHASQDELDYFFIISVRARWNSSLALLYSTSGFPLLGPQVMNGGLPQGELSSVFGTRFNGTITRSPSHLTNLINILSILKDAQGVERVERDVVDF
jgi:hypothetical protein